MSSLFVVIRLVHFVGGSVASQPISFHKTESEAAAAKAAEVELLGRALKPHGAKDLLQRIGIAAISFEVGEFKTAHADLIEVPRLIVPPS